MMLMISASRTRTIAVTVAAAAMLSSCAGGRDRPTIAVQRLPPLIVPPDLELLPPQQGDPRSSRGALQGQTLNVVLGGPSERSEVERDLLARAGKATPGIRSRIGDLQTNTVAKGRITQNILAAPAGDGRVAQAFAADGRP